MSQTALICLIVGVIILLWLIVRYANRRSRYGGSEYDNSWYWLMFGSDSSGGSGSGGYSGGDSGGGD